MMSRGVLLLSVGCVTVLFSYFLNFTIAGMWLYEPFFFPIAFAVAAAYGWWSRHILLSFSVGFFSIPLMIFPSPPYFQPFIFITNLLGFTDYSLTDTIIFCAFGAVSGTIGVIFALMHRKLRTGNMVAKQS